MIKLPDFLVPLRSTEKDPPNCKCYGLRVADSFSMFLKYFPIPTKYANSFDEHEVIKAIHNGLDEDQGLIEVEKGITPKGLFYIFSIIKSYMGPQHGVQYFVRLNLFKHLKGDEWAEEVDAFFDEEGTTGQREAVIAAKLGMPEDWMEDPYDKDYTIGIRMNKSEDKKYDSLFPNHPLSSARAFIKMVLEDN